MKTENNIPIHLKLTLTIKEASEYSNIGINKIDSLLRSPNCPFVLFVGTKKLVKRKEFEKYISEKLIIWVKTQKFTKYSNDFLYKRLRKTLKYAIIIR